MKEEKKTSTKLKIITWWELNNRVCTKCQYISPSPLTTSKVWEKKQQQTK
jgi:hypothetical protein